MELTKDQAKFIASNLLSFVTVADDMTLAELIDEVTHYAAVAVGSTSRSDYATWIREGTHNVARVDDGPPLHECDDIATCTHVPKP